MAGGGATRTAVSPDPAARLGEAVTAAHARRLRDATSLGVAHGDVGGAVDHVAGRGGAVVGGVVVVVAGGVGVGVDVGQSGVVGGWRLRC